MQPLSREHHEGLLLSWKIREGFRRNVAPERIKRYCDWFWKNHLIPHFHAEETHVFTILGLDHELIIRAVSEHRNLEQLFSSDGSVDTLTEISQQLESHIRFEERVLFNKIQDVATPDQMVEIEKQHDTVPACEKWEDEFWALNELT